MKKLALVYVCSSMRLRLAAAQRLLEPVFEAAPLNCDPAEAVIESVVNDLFTLETALECEISKSKSRQYKRYSLKVGAFLDKVEKRDAAHCDKLIERGEAAEA